MTVEGQLTARNSIDSTATRDSQATQVHEHKVQEKEKENAGVQEGVEQLDDDERVREGRGKGFRFWAVFASLLVATFMAALEQTALSTALPSISASLDATADESWIANAYLLASAAWMPWAGGLAQIFGRRPVLLVGLAFFALGSILCGAAVNMNMMLAGRGVSASCSLPCLLRISPSREMETGIQGAGGGIIFVLVEVVLSDIVPLSERGVYQGCFSCVWTLASATGPIIGGAFASFDWTWLFWINLPLSALVAAVVVAFMRLKAPEGRWMDKLGKMDWCASAFSLRPLWISPNLYYTRRIGNLVFIPSISVLILGLVSGGTSHSWSSAYVLASIICGAAGLVAWFFVEKHYVEHPTVPFAALMNRTSIVGYVTNFLHGVIALSVYYMPAYFQSAKAYSTITSAVDFLPVVCIVSPMALVTGLAVNRTQKYKALNLAGWVFLTIGCGLLSITTASTSRAGWVLLPAVVALGIGINYAAPVFPILAPLPPSLAGQALAFQMLVRTAGNVIGIAIGLTTLTNQLARKLPQAFLDMIPGGASGAYSSIPLIRHLEEPLKTQVRVAFAQSLRTFWIVLIPFGGVGLLIALCMESIPLNDATDENWGVKEKKRDSLDSVEKAEESCAENSQALPPAAAEAVTHAPVI
ncbi:SPOSA6832_02063, partial [Sporobolomyces salmonicolor]